MIVVLDANAVIGLAKGGIFDLLPRLFGEALVTPEIIEDVASDDLVDAGYLGAEELREALRQVPPWVRAQTPSTTSMAAFSEVRDDEDRSVIALAYEVQADGRVTDDERLRRVALQRGIPLLFVAEIVLLAQAKGLLAQVRPALDRMRAHGFGIADCLYQLVLNRAGE